MPSAATSKAGGAVFTGNQPMNSSITSQKGESKPIGA
eukprot:CAMPEP_0170473530 /NCGR_PEP_ID=MMETSP0123-20130129/15434_1 /TAXON_ID=182087 /ORGANISM="Favella ehrenbergii, Strain Fehren 1" /LENGTH=36 /DNA_ID= /DNA_START= /DNA_END= /DNA_ORIENTATION=